jgi:hypothetical protein
MLQSRLGFFIGAGTLLSAAFVNPARPYRRVGRIPMSVAQEMYDRGIDQ